MIPVLKGDGITLRGFTWADFPAFADMWEHPKTAKYIPFAPVAREESWARLNGNSYRWVGQGVGNWAVVDDDGRFLGTTGFFRNPGAGMGANYDASLQSGWVFAAHAHGRGVATQAVRLAHNWLDASPFACVTYCGMDVDHIGSRRVGEKNGYVFENKVTDQWGEAITLRRKSGHFGA